MPSAYNTTYRVLLARKAMTNLDTVLKSRDITLWTKVCVIKSMVFPVVMYRCESWTIKQAERQRIDAFELWSWRIFKGLLACKEIHPVNPPMCMFNHSLVSSSFQPQWTICSSPGSSVHAIYQARILGWGATSYFRGYSRVRIIPVSPESLALAGRFFTTEPPRKPPYHNIYIPQFVII